MNSLSVRKDRFNNLQNFYGVNKYNNLLGNWDIPEDLLIKFKRSIMLYISSAMHFEFVDDENRFMQRLEENKGNNLNVTPNGAVVPKKEYTLEYNYFIKNYCKIISKLIENKPEYLSGFRLTPNVRVKFSDEPEVNKTRPQSTAFPHTDAWLEGPWGIICHIPILGDCDKNYLRMYDIKDENTFNDNLLSLSENFESMQWVKEHYVVSPYKTKKYALNFCDYALLHETYRTEGAGGRVSIDSTLYFGEFDVVESRKSEYINYVPNVGEDIFIKVKNSENEKYYERANAQYHYTYDSLEHIML